jgi:O-antigen/teichoic acid export membrane protein
MKEQRKTAEPELMAASDDPPPDDISPQEVARRTVAGVTTNLTAQIITLVTGFARSVLLARLLFPADIGIVALALFFANLISSLATFGLNAGLIQRKTLEPEAVSTHFALRVVFSVLALFVTLLCVPLFRLVYPDRPLLVPLIVTLSGVTVIRAATSTPMVLLRRRLAFRRLALLNVASSVMTLIIAPSLALRGLGPWSLVLGEQLTGSLVFAAGVWLYRPPWRPSLRFNRAIARQFLRFGRFVVANLQISYMLDQFDDFWTATALGSTAAGYYNKAYELARYSRRIIAVPLEDVFFPAYARLQTDRLRLSQAYYRFNSLVVRLSFLLALIAFLVAPEFITLVLTPKWLPMVNTFRFMIIYTLLDPIIVTAGSLTVAVGQPNILTRIKLLQLASFVPGVIVLAALWGIEGVAVAADLMLLIGIVLVLRNVRRFVDFSPKRLFGYPLLALILGAAAGFAASTQLDAGSLWLSLLGKALTAGVVYSAVLLAFERAEYQRNLETVIGLLKPNRGSGAKISDRS